MELPAALKDALERELPMGPTTLVQSAQDLSRRYRQRETQGGSFLTGAQDAAAYATSRLPATYAAVRAAMLHSAACLPGFDPRTVLDAGCGPGTALWAAAQLWPDIHTMMALERDGDMRALAAKLAAHSPLLALRQAAILPADLCGPWEAPSADLVTACYVLGELAPEPALALLRRLWAKTQGTLLIVEPGTKGGFSTILNARKALCELGATLAAPCPQYGPCPLAEAGQVPGTTGRGLQPLPAQVTRLPGHETGDWCHFSQRLARSRAHRQLKGAELGYEDEKFSYICATRQTAVPATRVLRHPQVRKGHMQLRLCTQEGIREVTLSKKDGEAYRRGKDLMWGDAF